MRGTLPAYFYTPLWRGAEKANFASVKGDMMRSKLRIDC